MASSGDTTIGELLREARSELARAAFAPPTREASLLLARVLNRDEPLVLAHPEETLPPATVARFRELLERRLSGEPVAYLFGEREFYGRTFQVDSRVLIPRPETEHLIEAVLRLPLPAQPVILDTCTGSGCIAVTLGCELPEARLLATDLSHPALEVARANVERHQVASRVALAHGDLLAGVRPEAFDLIACNPPYIDSRDAETLSHEVRDFEPHLALFAQQSGRAVLTRLLQQARGLAPGRYLVVEIGYDQADWLLATVDDQKEWELLDIIRDYGGIPRTAVLLRTQP